MFENCDPQVSLQVKVLAETPKRAEAAAGEGFCLAARRVELTSCGVKRSNAVARVLSELPPKSFSPFDHGRVTWGVMSAAHPSHELDAKHARARVANFLLSLK